MLHYFLLVYVVTVVSSLGVTTTSNSSLYFGVFISQESEFDFSGFIPPLELGVKTVNSHPNVLKGVDGKNYVIEYFPIVNAKVRFGVNKVKLRS